MQVRFFSNYCCVLETIKILYHSLEGVPWKLMFRA